MNPEPRTAPPPERRAPVPQNAERAPHAARAAAPGTRPGPAADPAGTGRFPARYTALRRDLIAAGWDLDGPEPAPYNSAVELYTFTAPYPAARDGLTGDAVLIGYLRRIRLVLHTQAGHVDANLVQGHPGQVLWEVVGADDPDPDALLAAAHAAATAPPGAAAASTRTTGVILEQRGWSHARTLLGHLPEHHYDSPGACVVADYLPQSRFGDATWQITSRGPDDFVTCGPTPACVVNALLLTLAHTAPDTMTGH
jgi:hypothetical protein